MRFSPEFTAILKSRNKDAKRLSHWARCCLEQRLDAMSIRIATNGEEDGSLLHRLYRGKMFKSESVPVDPPVSSL